MQAANFLKHLFTYTVIVTGIFSSCTKNTIAATSPVTTNPAGKITIELKNSLPSLLKESSGLCYTNGNLWSFGDSGNPNAIYKIDTATGSILQTVTISNYPNTDWEDITADSLYIYIGDTGNNDGNRTDLKVLRIKKSDILAAVSQISVTAEAINFSYTDQVDFSVNSNTNFDCEAIVSIADNLYLFTKNRGDLQTRCYKLPKTPGSYPLSPISSFNTNGKITAAAYNHETNELALLGYMNQKAASFIWFFNDYGSDAFFNGTATRINIGKPAVEWQTEGLDYIYSNRLMLSCESTTTQLASLYSVQK